MKSTPARRAVTADLRLRCTEARPEQVDPGLPRDERGPQTEDPRARKACLQLVSQPLFESLPEITGAVSYCDTIVLWCWRPLPEDLFRSLYSEYGPRRFLPGKLIKRPGRRFRHGAWQPPILRRRSTIHQPARHTLRQLEALEGRSLVINEAHIAVDLLTRTPEDAEKLRRFLEQHLAQRWGLSGQSGGGMNNTIYANRDDSAARNIAIYSDRPSKTGLGHCCHVELRFKGAKPCKRTGLGQLGLLVQGPAVGELLARQTRLVFFKANIFERIVSRVARRKIRLGATSTVAEISAALRRLLPRCVQEETIDSGNDAVSPRQLWNWRSYCRGYLEQHSWASFFPSPTWWHWG